MCVGSNFVAPPDSERIDRRLQTLATQTFDTHRKSAAFAHREYESRSTIDFRGCTYSVTYAHANTRNRDAGLALALDSVHDFLVTRVRNPSPTRWKRFTDAIADFFRHTLHDFVCGENPLLLTRAANMTHRLNTKLYRLVEDEVRARQSGTLSACSHIANALSSCGTEWAATGSLPTPPTESR